MTNDPAHSIVHIAQTDQAKALALFNSLDISKQASLVHAATPEDKKELLFLAKDLSSLLTALPGRDVYLALESSTASEFDVLIERIGPEHLNFMLAMGCWRDGLIDDERFLRWLEILNNSDEALAARAISEIEADFLAAALRPHFDLEEVIDEDLPDNRGLSEAYSYTPEFCRFNNDTVEDFMERLFSTDRTLFALLCHKRVQGNPEEIFESARLAYSRRLEKEGLPSYEEAVAVYEKGWTILQKTSIAKQACGKSMITGDRTEPFLTIVFKHLNDSGRGGPTIANDFSGLLQKISVADGGAMDGMARQRTVRKAEMYTSLGLESMSKGDIETAAELVLKNGITVFFQQGFDAVSRLHALVNTINKKAGLNEDEGSSSSIGLHEQAILANAGKEIPRIMLETGKSRMIRSLGELKRLEEKIRGIEKGLL
jgi:hypothetical protein